MNNNWLDVAGKIFELVLIPLLGYAALCFKSWINAKTQEVKDKTKNENVKKYLDILDTSISEAVMATNQTYVDALKTAGRFDAEAQKQAFKQTFDAVMSVLTDDAQVLLNESVKDLNSYITNKIEAQIGKSKP